MTSSSSRLRLTKVHEELLAQKRTALGVERTPALHVDPSPAPPDRATDHRPAGNRSLTSG